MPSKDVFKRPGAQHFQLVHRSQRDPLIHDPEASTHVFKSINRDSSKKGKTRHELESVLSPADLALPDGRNNVGEASKYGVYFDDTKYDYMQHLRPVGEKDDNYDSVLLEAPHVRKGKDKQLFTIRSPDKHDASVIPPEFLPSSTELPRNYESQRSIQSSIAGFRPDMNPHLRQTLEALEDDEFVDDDLAEDFFGELIKNGEAAAEEELDFPFNENGLIEGEGDEPINNADDEQEGEQNWQERFARFKREEKVHEGPESELDYGQSEGGDTIGTLPHLSVIGARKRRKKDGSDASGYSMSSSSMYRNAGLTLLDEQFDRMYQKEYDEEEHDFDCDCSDCGHGPETRNVQKSLNADDGGDDSDEAPPLITTRSDFDSMITDFLDKFEIVGKHLRPVLEGGTGAEKLETLRKAIGGTELNEGEENKDSIRRLLKKLEEGEPKEEAIPLPHDIDDVKDRWDCETILSTYTNVENHPRVIGARSERKERKIRLDAITGLPILDEEISRGNKNLTSRPVKGVVDRQALRTEVLGENGANLAHQTISRPRDESKEEKQARKQTVKEEKAARRVDKKALKESFASERRSQVKAQAGREKGGVGLKKL